MISRRRIRRALPSRTAIVAFGALILFYCVWLSGALNPATMPFELILRLPGVLAAAACLYVACDWAVSRMGFGNLLGLSPTKSARPEYASQQEDQCQDGQRNGSRNQPEDEVGIFGGARLLSGPPDNRNASEQRTEGDQAPERILRFGHSDCPVKANVDLAFLFARRKDPEGVP